ncbi:MAG: hypothetical protein EOP84_27960 [Verrucomicrobiaceae bacterium]|nr:MAG: hypothetical protein EOP84_27960 [Verrucomicrobiaceae bacterium]
MSFAMAGMWVLHGCYQHAIDRDYPFVWLGLVLGILFATIPFALAYLAYQRRWREFLQFHILVVTVLAWGYFLTLPRYLSLLPPFQGSPFKRPDWALHVEGTASLVCLFASFPLANWFYRWMIRLLDRFFPPRVPVKDWIREAC